MRSGRSRRAGLTLVASLLLAVPRLAAAEEPPPENTNVVVFPPSTAASASSVPAAPSLVVPLDETRGERRKRLRVRVYDGRGVPSEMHLEPRYTSSQKTPLYVGVSLFGSAYAFAALVAVDLHPIDGVLLVPVAGPIFRGAQAFNHMGTNTGMFSGVADAADFVVGVMGLLDGLLQGTGVLLTVVGIDRMSEGRVLHLVPDEAHAIRREPTRVAVRPLLSIGGRPATGVGLTLTAF